MIYTDGIHIASDSSVQELHLFAGQVGIKRCWFENKKGKSHPHYDRPIHVPMNSLISCGAQQVPSRRIVEILKTVS